MYLTPMISGFSNELEKISMDKEKLKYVGKWAGGGALLGGLIGGAPNRHPESDRKYSGGERATNAAVGALSGGFSAGMLGHSIHSLKELRGAFGNGPGPRPSGPKPPRIPVGPKPNIPMGKLLPFKKLAFKLPQNPMARATLLSAAAGATVGGVSGASQPFAQDDYGSVYKPTIADRFAGLGQGAFRGGLAGGAIGAVGSHYLGK